MRASVGVTPALEQSPRPSGEQLGSTPEKMMSSLRSDRDVVCRQITHCSNSPQQPNKLRTYIGEQPSRHFSNSTLTYWTGVGRFGANMLRWGLSTIVVAVMPNKRQVITSVRCPSNIRRKEEFCVGLGTTVFGHTPRYVPQNSVNLDHPCQSLVLCTTSKSLDFAQSRSLTA